MEAGARCRAARLLPLLLLLSLLTAPARGACDVRFVRVNNTAGAVTINLDQIMVYSSAGVNVAYKQATTCLSVLSASYPCANLVSGSTVQTSAETFYNSAGSGPNEFAEIDLGATYSVQNITVYNRV